jgi:phosphoglycolate phosphatase-like HAD superfamily hydrolase
MIRLVVFNMDGTVLDSAAVMRAVGVSIMLRLQCGDRHATTIERALVAEKYDLTTGLTFREQLETAFPCDPRNDAMMKWYLRAYEDRTVGFSTAMWMSSILGVGQPYSTALISSTPAEVVHKMPQIMELPFNLIFGWTPGNPKSTQLADAVRLAKVNPDETLYVGDSRSDRNVAEAVGAHFERVTIYNVANVVRRAVLAFNSSK